MTSSSWTHLDERQLLRLDDGELTARESAEVRAHLEACWQCRHTHEQMRAAVSDYVRYLDAVSASTPPPPRPWGTIEARIRHTTQSRPGASPRFPRPAWYGAVAATLVIALLFFWPKRVLTAAELLHQAAIRAKASEAPKAIRIRTRTAQFTRTVRNASSDNVSLKQRFDAAGYSWQDPLSARSFSEWRDRLTDPKDQVVNTRDEDGVPVYRIATASETSTLKEATLTLREGDLRPLSTVLEFRDNERVEISEADDREPAPSVPVHRRAEQLANPQAPLASELQVWAALRSIDADLGEPVEVRESTGGAVTISGTGIEPDRQEEIRKTMERLPGIRVEFATAERVALPPRGDAVEVAVSRAETDKQADRLLDLSDRLLARAHALHHLAERFPVARESQLSERDLALLRSLRSDHLDAVRDHVRRLRAELRLAAAMPASPPPGSWQQSAERLLAAARETDDALQQIYAAARADGTRPTLTHLYAAITRLDEAAQ
jgi:anti-sigma factor RsiW